MLIFTSTSTKHCSVNLCEKFIVENHNLLRDYNTTAVLHIWIKFHLSIEWKGRKLLHQTNLSHKFLPLMWLIIEIIDIHIIWGPIYLANNRALVAFFTFKQTNCLNCSSSLLSMSIDQEFWCTTQPLAISPNQHYYNIKQ